MRYRHIRDVPKPISFVGLGGNSFTGAYGAVSEADAVRTVQRALELGVTLFDTSDIYGGGENERFLGRTLRNNRDEVTIVTKFGFVDSSAREVNAPPDEIRHKCEASLERLGLEVIDLYVAHRLDRRYPLHETVGALGELVDLGLVRAIGLPEVASHELREAHRLRPMAAVEAEFSLSSRDVDSSGLLEAVADLEMVLLGYSPLGRGLLAKQISSDDLAPNDARLKFPRFQGANLHKNQALATSISQLAAAGGRTSGQLLLGWIFATAPVVVPICGCRSVEHLENNVSAVDVELSAQEIKDLESLAEAVAGERYPEHLASLLRPGTT